MTQTTLQALTKCNAEAFNCVANLESYGYLDEGAMLGLKNWLSEQKILLEGGIDLDEPLLISSQPIRTDLTDTECVMILSGTVGGLMKMAEAEAIRRAALWLALDDEYWQKITAKIPKLREITLHMDENGRPA